MSDNTTDFFDGVGGGSGAPSAVLSGVGDFVQGEIVEMFKRDYIPYENRKSKEVAKKADGSTVQQLVVVLQTDLRNWANVSKVPRVDPADDDSPEKPPSEDDGKRAVYVPEGKNIQFAIGRAVRKAESPFEVGGFLGVKVNELKDIGRGELMKDHVAVYRAKSVNDGGFVADAAPAATPEPTPAPAPAPDPAPSQDPWATSGSTSSDEPPF